MTERNERKVERETSATDGPNVVLDSDQELAKDVGLLDPNTPALHQDYAETDLKKNPETVRAIENAVAHDNPNIPADLADDVHGRFEEAKGTVERMTGHLIENEKLTESGERSIEKGSHEIHTTDEI